MRKRLRYKKFLSIVILLLLLTANFCFAAKNLLLIPEMPDPKKADLPVYIKWVFDFGVAVLFFAILFALLKGGVLYILSGAMPDKRKDAKDQVMGAVTGFIIWLLLYLIVTTIYPPLSVFQIDKKLETPELPAGEPKKIHGVYFFEKSGCPSGEKENFYGTGSNTPDLTSVSKNRFKSVNITQDTENDVYHVAVIYDSQNYYGPCQYINPNTDCTDIILKQPPKSASVYTYSWSPSGDVTIYRNGGFNEDGGYLKITASEIDGLYEEDLKNLKFTGEIGSDECNVPKKDQDCKRWNKEGKCTDTQCPTLAGGNIGSIKIDGDYFVLLAQTWTETNGTWISDFCEAYPKDEDVNKNGPKMVKWDPIYNNSSGYYPSVITIVPVEY